eukprot:34554-Pyramimonas_sp.AAC.1
MTRLCGFRPEGAAETGAAICDVLVAEDNRANQLTIKHVLEAERCRVTIVANGREAVKVRTSGPRQAVPTAFPTEGRAVCHLKPYP